MKNITADVLRKYIETNEVVYKSCGELMEVSNDTEKENKDTLLGYFCRANRVEISNPGCLPPEIPVEKIKEPHRSYPRNKSIAQVLYLTHTLNAGEQALNASCKSARNMVFPNLNGQQQRMT